MQCITTRHLHSVTFRAIQVHNQEYITPADVHVHTGWAKLSDTTLHFCM